MKIIQMIQLVKPQTLYQMKIIKQTLNLKLFPFLKK